LAGADADGLVLSLSSVDDSAVAALAGGAFLLPSVRPDLPVFEDVAHAGARSKNAQQPSRQFRMVSFKPTMSSLRMMLFDVVLPAIGVVIN